MKQMKSKKGIEIAINFLVVFILGIAMLGLGAILIKQFYDNAIDTHKRISQKEEEQILAMLNRGEKVAMPINVKQIPKNSLDVFGVGIFNILPQKSKFALRLDKKIGYDTKNELIDEAIFGDPTNAGHVQIIFENEDVTIPPNEFQTVNIFVKTGKGVIKGTYIFTLKVYKDKPLPGNEYGLPVKFTVVIP